MDRCARPLIVVACLAACFASPSYGGDIPTIKLDRAGPNQPIDLVNPFYLTGDVGENVRSVHAVFVLVSDTMFGFFRRGCEDAALALENPKLPEALKGARTGILPVSSIFPPPAKDAPAAKTTAYDSLSELDAFVPLPWFKEGSADPSFKLLVSQHSPSFFRTGATYCMFLYSVSRQSVVRKDDLKIAMLHFAAPDDTTDPELRKKNASRKSAAFDSDIKRALEGADDATVSAIHQETLKLNAASVVQASPLKVAELLKRIPALFPFNYSAAAIEPPADYQPTSSGFGAMLAEALAAKGRLTRANNGGAISFKPLTGKGEARFIRLADGQQRIWIASDAKGTDAQLLEIALSDLPVPDAGIAISDLVLLARGRIASGGGGASDLSDLYPRFLEPVMGIDPIAKAHVLRDEKISAFADRFRALESAVKTASQVPVAVGVSPRQLVLAHFGEWLGPQLKPCTDELFKRPIPDDEEIGFCPKETDAQTKLLVLSGALKKVQGYLADYQSEASKWESPKLVESLTVTISRTYRDSLAPATDVSTRFDEQSWLFSYLTPVVGVARVTGVDRSFTTPFIGLQLTFFPNPVAEPIWTNGARDWKRMFAIQLAAGTSTGPLGDDKRHDGVDPFGVPLFVGASVQPFPYVSASVGCALMRTRYSTLSQENSHLACPFYWSVSAQVNVPDLIRQLVTKGNTSVANNSK